MKRPVAPKRIDRKSTSIIPGASKLIHAIERTRPSALLVSRARTFGPKNHRNSGNIESSISVLLLEAAWPPEQQGDAPVKMILAGVVVATLMVSPLFARSQAAEAASRSRVHPGPKKQSGAAYRYLGGSAWNSNQPTSDANPMKQGLCSTAPAFCPDYHGSNGA